MRSKLTACGHRCFEVLEPRALLAGDVTATVVDGTLRIEGDAEGNQLRLRSAENPGEFLIGGLPSSGTTINGQTQPQRFSAVRGVAVALGAGDDTIVIDEARIAGNVLIRTGEGNDRVVFGRPEAPNPTTNAPSVAIGGGLSIMTGVGNDTVAAVDLAVAHAVVIHTGEGDDTLRLGRPTMDANGDSRPSVALGGALKVDLGNGQNLMTLGHVRVHGSLLARSGTGNDRIILNHVSVRRAMEVWTGAGEDDLTVEHSSAAAAMLDTGIGDDRAALVDSTFRSLSVQLGDGDDVLSVKDTTARFALFNGGMGHDRLINLEGNQFAAARFIGFEKPDSGAVI